MLLLVLLALWLGCVLFVCLLLGREGRPVGAAGDAQRVEDRAASDEANASDAKTTGSTAA